MRDVNERDVDVVLNALELQLHLLAELEIEGAERFVQEQHPRLVHESSSEGDSLLLAAGKLPRLALPHPLETDEAQDLVHLAGQCLTAHGPATEPERHVLEDRQVRKQGVRLEDGVHVALVGGQPAHFRVAEKDLSFSGLLEAADHPQRRRLAATRRAEQCIEAPVFDLEAETIDCDDVLEPLRDVDEPNVGVFGCRDVHRPTRVHASVRTSPRIDTI